MSWLDSVVEKMQAKNTKTASKKSLSKEEINEKVKTASKIAIKKSLLKKASVGSKVKYNGYMWEVIDTNFKDAAGSGIVLKKIAAISDKKVTDPPEYARTNPGDVYDYEVRDSYEVPELNETAAQTEVNIAQENAIDRTTPAGRATNPYVAPAAPVVEEPVVEEAPVEEAPAEEAPVEEAPVEEAPVEEAPAEEAPAEEAPAEEVVEDEGVPAEHDMEEEDDFKKDVVSSVNNALKPKKVAKRENPILASIKEKTTNRIIKKIIEEA